MEELKWVVEEDNGEYSLLRVGDFVFVVYHDTREWFVNNENGDIEWFRLIEGECSSVEECRKDALECMADLAKSFAKYSALMEKLKVS